MRCTRDAFQLLHQKKNEATIFCNHVGYVAQKDRVSIILTQFHTHSEHVVFFHTQPMNGKPLCYSKSAMFTKQIRQEPSRIRKCTFQNLLLRLCP